MGENNALAKAFTPSWDSQGTPASPFVQLAPSHTSHQTDEVGGPPGQSLSALGWKLHPFNEMLIITAPT